MAAQMNNTREIKSSQQMSTLPITCQICLGKVRQPVLCSNCHVFCGPCMNIWLEKNQKCPACRVPIDDINPVRHIRGGLSQQEDEEDASPVSSPQFRKMRFDLLYKDYEDALDKLQKEVKFLKTENAVLKSRQGSDHGSASSSGSKTSLVGSGGATDHDRLLLLTSKLQDAQKLYDRVKQDMNKLKQENSRLKDENVNLSRENAKLREEIGHRSPHRYGRLTVATLESQVESQSKEVHRLTKALERSDQYIEDLQHQLQSLQDSGRIPASRSSYQAAKPPAVSSADIRQMHSSLRGVTQSSSESFGERERELAMDMGYDYKRLSREAVDDHPAKRQLFSSENDLHWSRENGASSGGLRKEPVPDSMYSDRHHTARSSTNYHTERDQPESIMKKPNNKHFDPFDRPRSPNKKVQFDLQEKKSESSSFDLEQPSPLTPSSSMGQLSMDSPTRLARRLPVAGDVLRRAHSASPMRNTASHLRRSDTDLFRSSVRDDISKHHTLDPHLSRLSPMSHNFDHYTSKNLSKKMITGSGREKTDNDSSHLSEPDLDTPRSLSSPEKPPPHSRMERNFKGRGTKPKNSSFDLEGPSLDDTQTIQSELNDLDISMTPELSDCMKLLNRAEKKMHYSDAPGPGSHTGTVSVSVGSRNMSSQFQPSVMQDGMGLGAGSSSGHVDFPRTYVPGTTGTMSSWEHGFFSTLRVNPYRHTATVPPPHAAHPSVGLGASSSQTYGSSLGGSMQDLSTAGQGLASRGGSSRQSSHYPAASVSGFSDLYLPDRVPPRTGGQPFSRPSSVPPSLGSASSSMMPNFPPPASLITGIYTHATTAPVSSSTYTVAAPSSVAPDHRNFLSGMSRDDLDIGRGSRYPTSRSTSGNYSYVSNTSSIGDSKNSDSFMPEPKKRLFDTDDEFDLSSPSKTTKIL